MNLWQRWLKQPQRTFLRRALFQVHLWTGLLIGLYLVAVSVSGSAIVFRNEILEAYAPGEKKIPVEGAVMPKETLKAEAVKHHPGYQVTFVFPKGADEPTEIWMESKGDQIQWLFNPYTGADMGNARPAILKWVAWAGQLHGNLLLGGEGLWWNGMGGLALSLVCLTGIVVWWPGVSQWKRALLLRGGVGWKRFNFDLHHVVGFWTMLLVLMWGATGAYFVFPDPVRAAIEKFTPIDPPRPPRPPAEAKFAPPSGAQVGGQTAGTQPPSQPPGAPRRRQRRPVTLGRKIIQSFSYAHYGNFAGWKVKALWAVLGLVPPLLFLTGAVMWWNRKIAPRLRRGRPPA
jgi:uncharacterized iron-regulated membrane protein